MKRGDLIKIKSYETISAKEARRFIIAGISPSMAGRIEHTHKWKNKGRGYLVRFAGSRCIWVTKKTIEPMNETPHQAGNKTLDFSDLKKIIKKIS